MKLSVAVGVLLATVSMQAVACDGSMKDPCVVQDTVQGDPAMKHFRSGADLHRPTWWVSGSAAPSEAGWAEIKTKIMGLSEGQATTVLDLDLRQESHGYLDGDAITLSEVHDWVNLGKTQEEVLVSEHEWLENLSTLSTVSSVITSDAFKQGNYNSGIALPVSEVKSEAEVVKAQGFQYQRLTIPDHRAPDPETVDQLLWILDHLPKNTWVHVHCRGGDGRTTTVMAMMDMLKNADKDSFDEIISRQASVYPYYDLRHIKQSDPVLVPYYEERLAFIQSFYAYAKARLAGNTLSWQAWSKR